MEGTLLVGDHLYVSKVAYGPRVPITPLSFPFAQNRLGNSESYLTWIKLDYRRLAGFNKVKRNDIVVFNFPAGDTVILENSAASFYSIVRDHAYSLAGSKNDPDWEKYIPEARRQIRNNNRIHIVERPVDRKDNYIKRCVAVPGDSLEIIHGHVYINGKPQPDFEGIQYDYLVQTNGRPLNPRVLGDFDIPSEYLGIQNNPNYILPLSTEKAARLKAEVADILRVEKRERKGYNFQLFPHDTDYRWNEDNFGPVWMPKKGKTVEINSENIAFYTRIIEAYEGNELRITGDQIFINGEETDTYTFQMDYYWMMGDNRHSSSDSRYWGFVPEDHIIGKPKIIWLSLDKDKKFLNKIRLNRMFHYIDPTE
jgi:signal peptidase I